ncbi:HEAT repeat domain-containing protein [Prochlorothrix hollandica]|uniref:HEAT repeat domain-containing protein n=1 Tax=Prochlorothrix hollandica TaxID=1223 RepID=UPI00333F1234
MEPVTAIIVGLLGMACGLGSSYIMLERRLNAQERQHQNRLNQEQERLTQVHNQRLQATTESLKSQYETRLQHLTAQLQRSPNPEVAAPEGLGVTAPNPAPNPAPSPTPEHRPATPQTLPPLSPPDAVTISSSPVTPGFWSDRDNKGQLQLDQTLRATLAHQPQAQVLRAISWLENLSRDANPRVRRGAIAALGQLQSRRVLPYLRRGLRDDDRAVVEECRRSLARRRHTLKTKVQSARHSRQKPPKTTAV